MISGESKMPKTKVILTASSTDEYFERARKRARAMDRGEMPPAEITISFEDPMDLLAVLTSERVRLLRQVKLKGQQISALAEGLKRDVRAVSRDISLLEEAGLVRTRYQSNPGHGRRKLVESVAQNYRLVADL
jgi:predicted transcriptional regulator